jgi:hypothetical protein
VYSGVSFFCEMVMIVSVFMIMYGLLAHFTRYSKGGAGWIVNGLLLAIGISCIYIGVFGASGPQQWLEILAAAKKPNILFVRHKSGPVYLELVPKTGILETAENSAFRMVVWPA